MQDTIQYITHKQLLCHDSMEKDESRNIKDLQVMDKHVVITLIESTIKMYVDYPWDRKWINLLQSLTRESNDRVKSHIPHLL